jgi:hypothetical protein
VPASLRVLTEMIREYADPKRERAAGKRKRRSPPAHGARR